MKIFASYVFLVQPTCRYVGNPVANAQVFVAKAVHNGDFVGSSHDVSRNSITPAVVAWAEAGALGDLGDLAAAEVCMLFIKPVSTHFPKTTK